jgi:hypothetical protein
METNPVFFGLLGTGVVAGSVSLLTGTLALIANASAKDGCIPERSYCKDQDSKDAASRAGTMAWISTGTLVVSAVALGALFFVPMRKARTVSVGIAPGGIGGTF